MLFLPSLIGYGVLAVTLVAYVWAQRSGAVHRNSFVGIRTQRTLRSDETWKAGHRAASPYLVAAADLAVVSRIALTVVDATGASETIGNVIAPSGFFAVLAVVVGGAVAAGKAADRVVPPVG